MALAELRQQQKALSGEKGIMSLTEDIKDFALDCGYSLAGITSADDFSDHIEEVHSRGAFYDFYVDHPRQFLRDAKPKGIMPSAKSIISLVWDYTQKAFPPSLIGKVGRIYQSRCYMAPPNRINGARPQLMVDFLKKAGCEIGTGIMAPDRRVAARAGVTTFGKNNFAYAKGIGSFVQLTSLVVDKELKYDTPTFESKCPKNCTQCRDACPTGAIYEPFKLNPKRCIAYNTFWTQDNWRPHTTSYIPPEIREKMGTWVHGCDACQEACPRNAPRMKTKLPQDPYLVRLAERFSLTKMLEMSDVFFGKTVLPIMYNYMKDKKYFQRNAAIALGNTGDPEHIPALDRAMEDPEELVRGYAAWALGRIGGSKAKAVLELRSKREDSSFVVSEIKAALPASELSHNGELENLTV